MTPSEKKAIIKELIIKFNNSSDDINELTAIADKIIEEVFVCEFTYDILGNIVDPSLTTCAEELAIYIEAVANETHNDEMATTINLSLAGLSELVDLAKHINPTGN